MITKFKEKGLIILQKILKCKIGSITIESLIAIAVLGTLAIVAFTNISTSLTAKNNDIIDGINDGIQSGLNQKPGN